MKPVRLTVRGFTAFRESTTVEFDGRRLFVITGPTGAGKSSLLDAMMWALYGQVPRVGRSVRELVSQGEREMSVLFEFTVRGRPYRVARRHPGTTSTRLEREVDGQWVPMADRATDVTRQVESLLGMDYATFTRAIVLPQGQFDSFLRGDTKDRRAILSQLIGLGVYQEAAAIARARAATGRTEAAAIRSQLEQLQFATPEVVTSYRERLKVLTAEEATLAGKRKALTALRELATDERGQRTTLEQAKKVAEEAHAAFEAAQAALATSIKQQQAQQRAVEAAEAERATLAYDRDAHDRLKAQVALLDQRADAEAAVADARTEVEAAAKALASATESKARAATAQAEQAAATQAAERTLAEAKKEITAVAARAARALAAIEEEVTEIEARAQAAETGARDLESQVRELESLAATSRDMEADHKRATDTAARAVKDAAAAEKAAQKANIARDQAAKRVDQARAALDDARAKDAAAHLRSTLKPGDTCPVCGETVGKVTRTAAPRLGAAEAAVVEAEGVLATARAEAELAAAQVAATSTRVEETQRAAEAVTSRLDALDKQSAGLKVDRTALPAALKQATSAAAAEAKNAAAHRAAASVQREAAQALRDALARVPDDIEVVPAKRGTAAADELRAAIDAYRAALTAASGATAAAEAAQRALTDAEREANTAEREVQRATKAQADTEARLARLGGVEGDPKAVRSTLAAAEKQAARAETLVEMLREAREALAKAQASAEAATATVERERQRATDRTKECQAAETAATAARAALEDAWRETVGTTPPPSLKALKDVMDEHEADRLRVATAKTEVTGEIERASAQIEQATRMRTDAERLESSSGLAGAVARELQGDRFIAFLVEEAMQLLATDASDRLAQFTSGRYELVAEEDEFQVVDRLNADEQRSVKTLSGGETFLASLALALALSEHLPEISGTGGAVSLDSLFLDEGFGALDAESLDLAVQGLETLAEGSRMVGVISHVEELAERLPDRIRVEKGVHGSTVVG